MKRVKILSVMLAFALIIGTFAGCGGIKISSFYDIDKIAKETDALKIVNKADKLSYEDQIVQSHDDVIVYKSSNATQSTWTFYNYIAKRVIHTETRNLTDNVTIGFVSNEEEYVFAINSSWMDGNGKTQYKLGVYNSDGTKIKEVQSEKSLDVIGAYPEFNLDLLKIGNEFYRQNKGAYQLVATFTDGSVVPSFTAKNGKNYYYIQDDETLSIQTFDLNLNLSGYYTFPTYATEINYAILDNGNILVQYLVTESLLEDDYSFVASFIPVNLISKIINVENGKTKDVDLKYLVYAVASRNTLYKESPLLLEYDYISDSVNNCAIISEITDKQLDENLKVVSLDNSAKISDRFDNMFVGQPAPEEMFGYYTLNLPMPFTNNRYVVQNVIGQTLLLDEKGNTLGDITGATDVCLKYVIINGSIYDYNLNEVASCKDYDLYEDAYLYNSFIFTKTVDGTLKYYLFTDGQYKHITDFGSATITGSYGNLIVIKNVTTGMVSVYNEKLEVLLTTVAKISEITDNNGYTVLHGYNDTTAKYETYIVYNG